MKVFVRMILCLGAVVTITTALVGCQSSINGQTLPSPYYHYDDIQYFPHGPEFQLQNEANALKAAQSSQGSNMRLNSL
jgi:hypothetical protein